MRLSIIQSTHKWLDPHKQWLLVGSAVRILYLYHSADRTVAKSVVTLLPSLLPEEELVLSSQLLLQPTAHSSILMLLFQFCKNFDCCHFCRRFPSESRESLARGCLLYLGASQLQKSTHVKRASLSKKAFRTSEYEA